MMKHYGYDAKDFRVIRISKRQPSCMPLISYKTESKTLSNLESSTMHEGSPGISSFNPTSLVI